MPSYTLDELLEKMAPQGRRDKALISRCVDGLGLYAAQIAVENKNSSKIDELRKLAENLVCYWGLNDDYLNENAKPLDEYLQAFDERVDEARTGGAIVGDVYQSSHNVIFGLHRYGGEMVVSQGADAMKDILDVSDLMKEIAVAWEFEPDVLNDLTSRLEAEVQKMLDGIPLPGQPMSGLQNTGYAITQAILFDNDRGFALAHSPTAPASYVTWQFTNEDGKFNHYWGHYMGGEDRSRIDYISRVADYTRQYKVTEKPIPTAAVEVEAEQNYNMIDGVINNEGVPKPDLTDGQTYAEIRELAPETLPDMSSEEPEASDSIPVQVLTESQPMVTVTSSEHNLLRGIVKMPLYLANTFFLRQITSSRGTI